MTDLQRQLNKMMLGKMSPRECRALADALQVGHVIGAHLARLSEDRFGFTLTLENALQAIATDIDRTLVAEPPHHTRQGGVIAEGVQEELDELRHLRRHSRDILTQMEAREREATGIPKLKIQFNKVFGYFIEVSKVQQDKVPPHYVRRQTLVNSERFITDELKHIEEKILGAEDRILQLEEELFQGLIASLQQQFPLLMTWADLVARIDVFSALAELAVARNYCRPQVHDGETIRIVDGRHPVVEALSSEPFIANDTYLNNHSERLKIITGPNMGGKSTYLRQVALIVLMAQMGSYVSASEAEIGLVDRIFTRVGASDHLARGQSTFMVEMMETSHILRNATPSSLIILDEIGRGTSTFDGLSIAWSVAEYIADPRKIGAKTLFATHYHEMTDLAKTEPGVGNLHITVKEWDQQILFLRRIAEGPADQSYGIHVGQLAGLPHEVIKRARRILSNLERNELDTMGTPRLAKKADEPPKEVQTSLIPEWDYPFLEELRQLQVDELSPKEALSLLYRWKEHL
jgi:DNA mismatch repair protein MutS